MKPVIPILVFLALLIAASLTAPLTAQNSGAFVMTDGTGVVSRPEGFWAANAEAAKGAMGLSGTFVPSNAVPGIQAASPGASRYYGTDTNGVKGYWVLPSAGGGGVGDMLKTTYDLDNDGTVDAAEAVAWSAVTGKPLVFTPDAHAHAASDITSGVMAPVRLGSGSPSVSNYLRGDGSWDPIGVADLADMTTFGEALAAAADAAAGRSLLGVAIGSTPGTYAAGDDTRFLSTGEKTDLTDGGDSASHFHPSDRARANHTGTQTRSTISDFSHQSTHQAGGADALSGNLDAIARTTVRKNSGSDVGSRRRINIVEGSGITATIADDPANEEIDVVLSSTGGGGSGTNVALLDQAQTFSALQTFAAGLTTPSLNADTFNVGTLNVTNDIPGGKIGGGIRASNITAGGVIPVARLGSGTPGSGNFLRGDGAWTALDDDAIGFDDADNVWNATNLGPALEELNDPINAGVPNGSGAKVHWSQLLGVPAGFADGTDDGAGGGGGGGGTIDPFAVLMAGFRSGSHWFAFYRGEGADPVMVGDTINSRGTLGQNAASTGFGAITRTSAGTNGAMASAQGGLFHRGNRRLYHHEFAMLPQTNGIRWWFALTSVTDDTHLISTNPAANFVALRYDPAAGDTNVVAMTKDGTSFTIANTGFNFTPSVPFRVSIEHNPTTNAILRINGNIVANLTTTLPSTNVSYRWLHGIVTLAANADVIAFRDRFGSERIDPIAETIAVQGGSGGSGSTLTGLMGKFYYDIADKFTFASPDFTNELASIATANPSMKGSRLGPYEMDGSGSAATPLGGVAFNSGAAAFGVGSLGRPGIFSIGTSSSTNGGGTISSGDQNGVVLSPTNYSVFFTSAQFPSAANANDRFALQIGWHDASASSATDPTDNVMADYNSANSPNWRLSNRSNSSETPQDSTAAYPGSDTWGNLAVIQNGTNWSKLYWNGAVIATNTAAIPTGNSRGVRLAIKIKKLGGDVGTTAKSLLVDYVDAVVEGYR